MSTKDIEKTRPSERGLTLIELLAAVAILGILLTPLVMTTVQGMTLYYREQEKIELMNSGQIALDRISNAIRRSGKPVAVAGPASLSIGESLTYEQNGRSLRETIDGTPNEIACHIDTLVFSLREDLLTVDLTLKGPKYNERVHLSTALHLKNQDS